jgi:hypothetical protein
MVLNLVGSFSCLKGKTSYVGGEEMFGGCPFTAVSKYGSGEKVRKKLGK